jgi:hypothetical protein
MVLIGLTIATVVYIKRKQKQVHSSCPGRFSMLIVRDRTLGKSGWASQAATGKPRLSSGLSATLSFTVRQVCCQGAIHDL